MSPTFEARNLRRHYSIRRSFLGGRDVLKALDGVSFVLGKGQTLAVVGESGCGKTTLAKQVALVDPPTAGHLFLGGEDVVLTSDPASPRRKIQIVFQNALEALNPRQTVGASIAEPLAINTMLSRTERRERAQAMMVRVGLQPEHYGRYPHMFSGGQRQRIDIARALTLRPLVVVADEPVSALDLSVQAQILNLLMDLRDEFALSYVFISHDLGVVRHIADDAMVMYAGRAVEQGTAYTVLSEPRHPYTRALLEATPRADRLRRRDRPPLVGEVPSIPPPGCAFHTRCPYVDDVCRRQRPEPRAFEGRDVACHHLERVG